MFVAKIDNGPLLGMARHKGRNMGCRSDRKSTIAVLLGHSDSMRWTTICLVACFILSSPMAQAATTESRESPEAAFLGAIVLLLFFGRLLGELMQRLGQPAIMGQLIAGLILGPSVFGVVWPDAQQLLFPSSGPQKTMITGVAQLGVLLLLLLAGMETDLGLAKKVRRAAISASVAGVAIPFAFGVALGEFLPESMLPHSDQRLITALFLGTAMSISSVKIVAIVVREMDFLRRDIGQVIVASAIIDDTIGWIVIAVTLSLAQHGSFDVASLAKTVAGTAAFLVASFTIGRRLIFLLIRWANDNFICEVPVITAILIAMGCMALITDLLGVSTVLGAFVAGVLVGQSPILTKHIDEQLRGLITALFMPIFFGLSGLSADLLILGRPELLLTWGLIVLIASVGKFSGAFLGGWVGGLTRRQCLALASGMNARGSTEIIVATIGLSVGALSQDLYTMIVAMAVVTTMAMPPTLRWALRRLPVSDEERQRLERESAEMSSFFSDLERLIIAVDSSASGKLGARLAGMLASARGMPVTVVRLGEDGALDKASETAVIDAARKSVPDPAKNSDALPIVDVTTHEHAAPPEEAVANATRRGHGLLIIGVANNTAPEGGFHEEVTKAARGFDGHLAIVSARGMHRVDAVDGPLDILVPMTGAETSRRGAEVALRLARAAGAPVTALLVASPTATDATRRGSLQPKENNAALLREIVRLGEHYGVNVRTAVRVNIAPADAILRQARLGDHNMIVMGVSRRLGDALSFGDTASAVLESSDRSLVFISGETR